MPLRNYLRAVALAGAMTGAELKAQSGAEAAARIDAIEAKQQGGALTQDDCRTVFQDFIAARNQSLYSSRASGKSGRGVGTVLDDGGIVTGMSRDRETPARIAYPDPNNPSVWLEYNPGNPEAGPVDRYNFSKNEAGNLTVENDRKIMTYYPDGMREYTDSREVETYKRTLLMPDGGYESEVYDSGGTLINAHGSSPEGKYNIDFKDGNLYRVNQTADDVSVVTSYDARGQKISEDFSYKDGKKYKVNYKDGAVSSEIANYPDGSQYDVSYHDNQKTEHFKDSQGNTHEVKYGKNGQMTMESSLNEKGEGDVVFYENGRPAEKNTVDAETGKRHAYKFDDRGNIAEWAIYDGDQLESLSMRKYNEYGQLIHEDFKNSSGLNKSDAVYGADGGALKSETFVLASGETHQFQYGADGGIIAGNAAGQDKKLDEMRTLFKMKSPDETIRPAPLKDGVLPSTELAMPDHLKMPVLNEITNVRQNGVPVAAFRYAVSQEKPAPALQPEKTVAPPIVPSMMPKAEKSDARPLPVRESSQRN